MALLNDDRLVSGSDDKTFKVWNYKTGALLKTLTWHTGSVMSLAVLDETRLLTGSDDASMILWNTSDWSQMRRFKFKSKRIKRNVKIRRLNSYFNIFILNKHY